MVKIYNGAQVVKYQVSYSFVSVDEQNGYQRHAIAECATPEEAIAQTLPDFMNETMPLKGISVHQLVYAC